MIVPINQIKNGSDETIGTARVAVEDGKFAVEFYPRPNFVLDDKVKSELEKELIKLAKKQFGGFSLG